MIMPYELSYFAVLLAILGQAADVYTTVKLLGQGGSERRWVNRWLQDKLGVKLWAPVKVAAMAFLLGLAYRGFDHSGLFGASIAFAGVGFWYARANYKRLK